MTWPNNADTLALLSNLQLRIKRAVHAETNLRVVLHKTIRAAASDHIEQVSREGRRANSIFKVIMDYATKQIKDDCAMLDVPVDRRDYGDCPGCGGKQKSYGCDYCCGCEDCDYCS